MAKLSDRELALRALREAHWRASHGESAAAVEPAGVSNSVSNAPITSNNVSNISNNASNKTSNISNNASNKVSNSGGGPVSNASKAVRLKQWRAANADRYRAYMRDYMRRRRGSGEAIKNPGA